MKVGLPPQIQHDQQAPEKKQKPGKQQRPQPQRPEPRRPEPQGPQPEGAPPGFGQEVRPRRGFQTPEQQAEGPTPEQHPSLPPGFDVQMQAPPMRSKPTGPPVPALQKIGYWGSIRDFNDAVAKHHDDWMMRNGAPPDKQTMLSQVLGDEAQSMQKKGLIPSPGSLVPKTVHDVKDGDYAKREDGFVQRTNPIQKFCALTPNDRHAIKTNALQKAHPWVAMGALPVSPEMEAAVFNSFKILNVKNPEARPLVVGGLTPDEFEKQLMLSNEGMTSTPTRLPTVHDTQPYELEKKLKLAREVESVKGAQQALQKLAPDIFVDQQGHALPLTGYINSDWAAGIKRYMSTPTYFRQQTRQLSANNGFGNNTGAFVAAWKNKQSALKNHPYLHQVIMSAPLWVFKSKGWESWKAGLRQLTGDPHGWSWLDVPSWGLLHPIEYAAKTGLNVVGGTYDNIVADAVADAEFFKLLSEHSTTKDMREKILSRMQENSPHFINILDPSYGGEPHKEGSGYATKGGKLAVPVDIVASFLTAAPEFNGEFIRAGESALKSTFFNYRTAWAYNDIKAGELLDAHKSLGATKGSRSLIAITRRHIQEGNMSLSEFRQHADELIKNRYVEIPKYEPPVTPKEGEPAPEPHAPQMIPARGAILPELSSKHVPTPGRMRLKVQDSRRAMKSTFEDYETGLRNDPTRRFAPGSQHAVNFVNHFVQEMTHHVAPANDMRAIWAETLPQNVYDWVMKTWDDKELAKATSNKVVVAQGAGNEAGLIRVQEALREKFLKDFPDREWKADPLKQATGEPALDTESRAYWYFPDKLASNTAKMNKWLNKVARVHREVLVSGAPLPSTSLGYKHLFADTGRRAIGGGFGRIDEAIRKEAQTHFTQNLDQLNEFSVARAAAKEGEYRWIEGNLDGDPINFGTGDVIKKNALGKEIPDKSWQKAAGGYLRRQISSGAIKAYMESSAEDLNKLKSYLLQSSKYRQIMASQEGFVADRAAILETYKPYEGQLAIDGMASQRDMALKNLEQEYAQLHAATLFQRYQEIEQAGLKAGMSDPLNEALSVLVKEPGAEADATLGKWIAENNLDFPVRQGLVRGKRWDDPMSRWIKFVMTANRWNRGGMFDQVFYSQLKAMREVGIGMEDAVPAAIDLAKNQTYYHMLDFANMLQFEQDLRWVSYFLTKRRLYWKWLASTAVHRPGVFVAAHTLSQHLDPKGNLNFNLFGWHMSVPMARLLWLNDVNTTYPEISPILQGAAGATKGVISGQNPWVAAVNAVSQTSGNIFTRDDTTFEQAAKLIGMETGHLAATADNVTSDMGPTEKLFFNEAVNKYSAFYYEQHGHWPSEANAVKHVLLSQMAQGFWQNNLPLPVTWNDPSATPPAIQKEITHYHQMTDPAKAREFLDKHPEVALRIGVSEDPAVFIQTSKFWGQYNAAYKVLQARQDVLYQELKKGNRIGFLQKMSKLSKWWSDLRSNLMLQDAESWQGNAQFPKGEVSDGQVVTPGPFTIQLQGDPTTTQAFIHQMFPRIPGKQISKHVIGENVSNLRKQVSLVRAAGHNLEKLKALGYINNSSGTAYDQARVWISGAERALSPFYGMPRGKAQQAENDYYSKYVDPYIKKRTAWSNRLQAEGAPNASYAKYRAWKDSMDHDVYVTVNGEKIKFPSPVRVGWLTMPAAQRRKDLSSLINGMWSNIGSYEKSLLGVETKPDVAKGWAKYEKTLSTYEANPVSSYVSAQKKLAIAKILNRDYPGFLNDYLFSLKTKAQRFTHTNLYKTMPDRPYFDEHILKPALLLSKAIESGNHTNTMLIKWWKLHIKDKIEPALANHPILQKELENYGPHFLETLVESQ